MNVKIFTLLMVFVLPVITLANTDLRDPTRPANYLIDDEEPVFFEDVNLAEKINWKLSAIRISSADRTAILNGKLVRVGDLVGPAKVLEINPLSIVIDHEERKLIVRLYKTNVIKNYKSQK